MVPRRLHRRDRVRARARAQPAPALPPARTLRHVPRPEEAEGLIYARDTGEMYRQVYVEKRTFVLQIVRSTKSLSSRCPNRYKKCARKRQVMLGQRVELTIYR